MAIIDPEGLFSGDRLAACSDMAQLLWPRLFIAANSCARLELSYTSIISKIFKNFRKPPKADELWAIFEEYDKNCLALLYEVNGTWWCQFVTSEKYLPKYKRTRDSLTPAPTEEAMKVFNFGYLEWKKANSFNSHIFRKSPEVSNGKGREGVGVGVGVGEEKTLARLTSSDAEAVYEEYPRKVGRRAALKAIASAIHRIDDPDPVNVLIKKTREFARSPAGQRGEFTPHPSTFYNQSRYLDDPEEWEKVR